MPKTADLFDLSHSLAGGYLGKFDRPWEALAGIASLIETLGPALGAAYREISPRVWVHETAVVAPSAYLGAPCILGPRTEVRHCAFIRGSALVGEDCVVGNSVEIKNAILFDGVQVPHFNYVGDSILGYRSHMGAGSVTSNVRSDKGGVSVVIDGRRVETGLKKLGAMVGDRAEVGCNAVLNPGSILGRNSAVYPASCLRGTLPENAIWKNDGSVVVRK